MEERATPEPAPVDLWADTTDGDLLRHLFGYYPTLHDATITEFVWKAGSRTLTAYVDYDDLAEDGEYAGQEVSVQIALIWTGVTRASLPMEEYSIIDFGFRLRADQLETWWTVFNDQYSVTAARFDFEIRRDRPKDAPMKWRIE